MLVDLPFSFLIRTSKLRQEMDEKTVTQNTSIPYVKFTCMKKELSVLALCLKRQKNYNSSKEWRGSTHSTSYRKQEKSTFQISSNPTNQKSFFKLKIATYWVCVHDRNQAYLCESNMVRIPVLFRERIHLQKLAFFLAVLERNVGFNLKWLMRFCQTPCLYHHCSLSAQQPGKPGRHSVAQNSFPGKNKPE